MYIYVYISILNKTFVATTLKQSAQCRNAVNKPSNLYILWVFNKNNNSTIIGL